MRKQKPLILNNPIEQPKTGLEWFKKNIVIVPVIVAILAGSFTSIKYVLNLTDYLPQKQHGTWQKIYIDNLQIK